MRKGIFAMRSRAVAVEEWRVDCLPRGKPPECPQAHILALWIRRLPEGVQGASGKPPARSAERNLCRRNSPLMGIDAPTPARIGTCRPMGRSHFSFGGERKVCKRKPAARRLREKGFYCPFWRRGSLCRAQRSWPAYACYRARSELAFFRRQNGRAFFPPLPIAALLPRSRRRAGLSLAGWDDSRGLAVLQRQGMRASAPPCVHGLNDLECERPAWFRSHAGLYCEP